MRATNEKRKEKMRSIQTGSDILFFLVGRLVAVVLLILACEALMAALAARVVAPRLQVLSDAAGMTGSVTGDLLGVMQLLVRIVLFRQSLTGPVRDLVLMAVLMILFFLVPIFAGVFLFASMTSSWIREDRAMREKEHEAYDRRKNLLLSDMAHDLRTPIQTIEGYSKALSDGIVTDPEKQKEYLTAIEAKSVKLSSLINLLFDYVKVGSEGYHLNPAPADFHELLRSEAAAQYTDFEEAGQSLEVTIPDDPWIVTMDEAQVRRVISNLLVNARRHNGPGTKVLVCVLPRAGLHEVCVADSGTAIECDPAALFEPFARGDAARTSDGGTGLGLSIAKKIVEMHEGWSLSLVQPFGDYTKAFVIRVPD